MGVVDELLLALLLRVPEVHQLGLEDGVLFLGILFFLAEKLILLLELLTGLLYFRLPVIDLAFQLLYLQLIFLYDVAGLLILD